MTLNYSIKFFGKKFQYVYLLVYILLEIYNFSGLPNKHILDLPLDDIFIFISLKFK